MGGTGAGNESDGSRAATGRVPALSLGQRRHWHRRIETSWTEVTEVFGVGPSAALEDTTGCGVPAPNWLIAQRTPRYAASGWGAGGDGLPTGVGWVG
jgi:hypothetical protein